MPAAMMMKMGLTPSFQMSNAETRGIQQVASVMLALFAMLNVGTAIKATTAGRMPLNIAATQGTSMKWWKNMAMSRMMKNEGRAVPNAEQRAPRSRLNL